MKKRAIACLALLVMLVFAISVVAFANENSQSDTTTYEGVDSQEKWNLAIESIESQSESNAVIVLTDDVGIFNNQYKYSIGVPGKHITVKSEGEGAPFSIGARSMSTVNLGGDVTFDNVWLSLGQGSTRSRGTISSFYANGYTAEFTERFAQVIVNLYGGSNGTKITASSGSNDGGTHLIIDGDIICSSNSQNSKVFGGGLYSSSSNTGSVAGNTLIDLGPHCRVPWVYGGGENSSVGGDVTINLNGDVADENHIAGNITGGGRATSKGPSNGKDSGTVAGNINLNLYSGRFAAISSGGGTNETSTASATIQNSNKEYYGMPYRYYATVGGDVNIRLGKEGAQAGTCHITTVSESLSGSLYSVIQGSVNVTINDGTQFGSPSSDHSRDHDIYGMGYNDIVEGSVNLTMSGGEVNGDLYGLGVTVGNSDGCHQIGRTDDPKEESYYSKDALTVTLNGGKVDNIAWFYNFRNSLKASHAPKIYGNVIVNIAGGEVGCVYFGNPEQASPVEVEGYQPPYVYGSKGMELHVAGGTFTNVNQSICAHSFSRAYKGQRIYFENDESMSLYRIYNADSNKNGDQADIIVNNTAPVQLKNYRYASASYIGNYRGSLYDCGDLDIQSGTLVLPGQNKILGDFHIGENASLVTNGKLSDDVAENGFLNVGGKATGQGNLLVARSTSLTSGKGWINCGGMTPQLPDAGEVYLRSNYTDETASNNTDANLLDLENAPNSGRYVEYTTDVAATTSDFSHAWRIAQGQISQVPWYYEVYYQNSDGTFTKWKDVQGGWADAAETVSISSSTFDGTDLGWLDVTGKQNEILGKHYVFDETNPGNRLSAPAGEATENNPLKIYYKCAPHIVSYKYDSSAPVGATPPATENDHYYSEENITPAMPTAVEGYTFKGWTVELPAGLGFNDDGTFTMPNDDVVLVGGWIKDEAETISIRPADVTIYMGGSGYKGTVTGTGNPTESGFPEPGFIVELPDELQSKLSQDGKSVSDLKLRYSMPNGETLSWTFEEYGEGDHDIYRIVPDEGAQNRPVRMEFIKTTADGEEVVVDSDDFDYSDNLDQTLQMKVYGEGVEEDDVKIVYGTNEYGITADTGLLTVRATSDAVDGEQYGEVLAQTETPPDQGLLGGPSVIAPEGTVYSINGSAVQVDSTHKVALLFDEILETEPDSTSNADLLVEKAKEELEAEWKNVDASFYPRYLDLVDRDNGNAWVAASNPVTVCWPIPDGVEITENTLIAVLHYPGLHREMGTDEIPGEIDQCDVEVLSGDEIGIVDGHVAFTVQPYKADDEGNVTGGFSPYVLAIGISSSPAMGGLSVSKSVAGEGAETDRAFDFTVTLDDASVSGSYGGMLFEDGVASFSLRHGETVAASGLPAGVGYAVTEAEAGGYASSSTGASGTIPAGSVAAAAFTNTKEGAVPPPATGEPSGEEGQDSSDIGYEFDLRNKSALPNTGDFDCAGLLIILGSFSLFGLLAFAKMGRLDRNGRERKR